MIHSNVAFLVIRSTLENIVKILINASPHAVNKYTRNGLFRTIIATIWRMECVPTVYKWALEYTIHKGKFNISFGCYS